MTATDQEIKYHENVVSNDQGKTDLVMVSYFRKDLTQKTLERLIEVTKTPHRLTVVDNGSDDKTKDYLMNMVRFGHIQNLIILDRNYGLEYARNTALRHIHSKYCVFFDNDLLAPRLEPDWLSQQIVLMEKYPEYGCLALRPQVLVGAVEHLEEANEDVIPNNHVGATFMMFPTVLLKEVGWSEDFTNRVADWRLGDILKEKSLKMGWCRNIRCYHIFGKNWSYPEGVEHFHREIWPPAENYDNIKVDPDTLIPLS